MINAYFSTDNYDGDIRIWRGELFIKTDQFVNPQPVHSHGDGTLLVGNNEATRNLPAVDVSRAGELPRRNAIPAPAFPDPFQNLNEQASMNYTDGQGAFQILRVGSVNCVAGEERANQSFKEIDQRIRGDQQSEDHCTKLIYCSKVSRRPQTNVITLHACTPIEPSLHSGFSIHLYHGCNILTNQIAL